MNKKLISLCLSIPMMLSLIGCSSKTASQNASTKEQKIVLKDGLGRNIELSKKADRIVTNYSIPTHMLLTLGAQDTLLGADGGTLKNPLVKCLISNPEKLADFKNKNSFNIEEGTALKPDLVLINSKNKQLVENLESHGLKVFAVQAENMDELKSTMVELGKATGHSDRAEKFLKHYDDTVSRVTRVTSSLSENKKPRTYIAGSNLFNTCGTDMYQNYMIETCGGKNVAKELSNGWVKISPEQLVKWNPEVIFLTQYSGSKVQDVLSNSALSSVDAVKNKRVYMIPSPLLSWDMPSPEAVLGIQWMAKKLHPEEFKDMDVEKDANQFFTTFYGKKFTDLSKLE